MPRDASNSYVWTPHDGRRFSSQAFVLGRGFVSGREKGWSFVCNRCMIISSLDIVRNIDKKRSKKMVIDYVLK